MQLLPVYEPGPSPGVHEKIENMIGETETELACDVSPTDTV